MKASPEVPCAPVPQSKEDHSTPMCFHRARLCRAAGARKVLWSSLPTGACGQVQRRSRSEEARDEWWRIPSHEEGPLVSAERAGRQ